MPPPPTASTPATETATEKKSRKQRLVPDLSDQIEASGQRLSRVVRVSRENSHELEPEPPKLTLEDVARKHLDPKQARVIEENAELLRAIQEAGEEPRELSHAQALAERMELFTDGGAVVPHAEPDAEKREETMTMSPLVGLDDAPDFLAGKSPPQTIFDLFSLFPQLDGDNWFIYVERKLPKTFSGRKVDGMLRKISAPLTLEQWQYWYGGGTYKLIVYGPSKRASVNMQADGRVQPKALTEAITVVFPGAPSSASEVYDGDDDMTQPAASGFPNIPLSGRRGPASMADAHIDKAQLEVTAAREIRSETREERERAKAEQALKEKSAAESSMLKTFMDAQARSSERESDLRQQMMEREREFAEQRIADKEAFEERFRALETNRKPPPDDLDRVAKIAGIIGKPDNSEALRDQHAREVERLQTAARDDAARAQTLIKDAESRADLRIRDEQSRSTERIREVEKRFETLERDLRERTDREVQRAKEDGERRVSDMHRIHTDAMASEARNHQRDMEGLKAQHLMAMESLKNTYDMRLETQKSEVKRTSSEVDRWKKEAEENRDPLAKIEKIKEQAEVLGWVPADQAAAEPQTVPQMLMQMGGGLVQNLPGIVQNVSEMFKTRNAAELQAARLAGRAEMVEQAGQFGAERQLPPSHARRRAAPQLGAGYVPRHMSEISAAPVVQPGMDPYALPPQQQFQPEPMVHIEQSPHAFGPPVPQQAQPQQMQPLASVMPQQQQPPASTMVQIPPPPSIPAPSVAPPPMTAPAIDQQALADDQEILQAEQMLAPQYAASVPVPLLAEQMLAQFGPEVVTNLVTKVDAERVILAITRSGHPDSPFLRRDGKKYLRALFDELKKKVSGA